MKGKFIQLLLIASCFLIKPERLKAIAPTTCFEIESILVDACGNPEGENEMVRFIVGPSSLNVSNMVISWPNNNFLGICQNSQTAAFVSSLNSTIAGCGFIKEPVGGILPSGSTVLLITSSNANASFHSFANLNDTIYMIFQCLGNTSGHFANYSNTSGIRTLNINFGAGCFDAVTYDRQFLVTSAGTAGAADGALVNFTYAGTATYANTSCQAPIIPLQSALSASNSSVCTGAAINVTAVISSANYSSFFWTGGNGSYANPSALNTGYQTSSTFTGNDPLIFAIITNCNDTIYDTLNIAVSSGTPVAIAASGPVNFCTGDSVTLTANGGGNYLWSTGATTSSITVFTSNTYSVTSTSTCGNTNANQIVTVSTLTPASISASGPTTLCSGDSVTLTANLPGFYLWSTGATTNSITVSTANTYTVTITEACGTTSASQTVTVTTGIPVSITTNGSSTLCSGDSVVLSANGTGTFLWSNGASTNSITVFTTGNYSVTASGSCGTSTASQQVTFTNLPAASIAASGSSTLCPGDSVQLVASGGNNYLWSNGAATASIIVNSAGTFTVTVTGSCGSDTASQIISAQSIPVTVISNSGASTICQGTSVILTASGASNYAWSNGATTASITVSQSGTFSVTGSNNCGLSSDAVTIVVDPLPVASITSLNGSTTFCSGNSLTLQASGGQTYLWSEGTAASSLNIISGGTYTVTATNNCGSDITSVAITEISAPSIMLTADNLVLCPGSSTNISATGSATGYLWSSGEISNSITVSSSGNYVLTASNICGSDMDSVLITASSLIAAFTTDTTTGSAPLTVHFKNLSQLAVTVNWDFGDGKTSTENNPVHNFMRDGTYTVLLTVTDINGCMDTASAVVIIFTDTAAWVPNVFTPNGDHKNDIFNITGTGIADFDAKIFNRWGAEVYSWSELNSGWDGKLSGNDSPAGAYFYLIRINYTNGKHDLLRGNVTLLR